MEEVCPVRVSLPLCGVKIFIARQDKGLEVAFCELGIISVRRQSILQ
jgi:hypothetical protein